MGYRIKLIVLGVIYGSIFYGIELAYRGYSAWQMVLIGGLCGVLIGLINELFTWDTPLWLQGLIGSLLTTVIEFVSGCILNLWLGLGIWDYSHLPFNLLGQVCLYFSIVWFFLSLFVIVIDDYLRYWFFGEEKPRYKIF